MCGIVITLDGDQITAIRETKTIRLAEVTSAPKRRRCRMFMPTPIGCAIRCDARRQAGSASVGTMRSAARLSQIQRIQRMRAQRGCRLPGNPVLHNTGAMLYAHLYSCAAYAQSLQRFIGRPTAAPPGGTDHVWSPIVYSCSRHRPHRLFAHAGRNPLVSNGSLMTAAGVDRRLKRFRRVAAK